MWSAIASGSQLGLDFHLIASDIDIDAVFGPIDLLHRIGRELDMLAWPPVPRGDDEIADVPVGVVGEEVLHMAKVAVGGVDVIAVHRDDAAQMWIAVAGWASMPAA